jgi:hypothetical protein
VRPRFERDILMPGYSGSPTDTVAVDAFLTAKNPLGGDIVALLQRHPDPAFFDTPGSAAVPLPNRARRSVCVTGNAGAGQRAVRSGERRGGLPAQHLEYSPSL